jgi:hypothetical protein
MSLNIENFSIIWLTTSISLATLFIIGMFFIKKERQKLFTSIAMNFILVITNFIVIDPIFNLIFLSLLICNLLYFLLFILKRRIIEGKRQDLFYESTGSSENEKESSESQKKIHQNIGDLS